MSEHITKEKIVTEQNIVITVCNGCNRQIIDNDGCKTLQLTGGWPHHWLDCITVDFCSDQCVVDFFTRGINKHGGWSANTKFISKDLVLNANSINNTIEDCSICIRECQTKHTFESEYYRGQDDAMELVGIIVYDDEVLGAEKIKILKRMANLDKSSPYKNLWCRAGSCTHEKGKIPIWKK